ncbi:lysylphosphatidylglycerol synthase transmembrane domain-containing protein [Corynebacterium coyleae]|uniref:lysylphosphatidylglycerol synthase transmembrane domain-containing protein n=1 Tax=Corynebacterium coyleae TaxID=53374 RepID=UPI00254F250F|nr:YbhN family protein [Corynebacterium coyleae]MDK8799952.1 YbhN family protein [Corynebacterium coyleae]
MNARTWLRWIAPVVLAVVVLVVLRDQMPFFGDAWRAVRSASPLPLLGTVVTALLALVAMAGVMQILLNVEGRITGVARTNAIVFASNAWSTTVPGGPALSAWLTYRVHRSWGASTGLCGWFFVVSGALSTVWLVLIGIVAVVLLGADLSVTSLVLSLVAAALTIAAVFWATLNPAVLKRWVRFLPSRVHERAVSVIDQVSAIRISAPAFAGAAGLSLCNRLLDLATMVCSVWAVSSSSISLSGICLAFIMTKLAGSAQVTPGGLGTVEPVAVGMLVAGGLSLADATAATVIYRAISFALVTAIGWIVYSAVYLGRVDKPTA